MTRELIFLGLCLFICISEGEIPRPRGVAISKAGLYDASRDFKCLDGSLIIPFDRINDDFCDCHDGSDEPGTSACPNGSFHCTNAGYKPKYIPASRVNDGICDCCDGTDEFGGRVSCTNSCRELGRQYREEREQSLKLMQEGHQIYKDYSTQGKAALQEKQARLEAAKKEKEELEIRRDELEVAKTEAEAPEKEAKDRHKDAWELIKERNRAEADKEKTAAAFEDLDSNDDNLVSVEEIQARPEFDIDSNGEVSVEEAKEYLDDQEQVDFEKFSEKIWPSIRDIYKKPAPEGSPEEADATPEKADKPTKETYEGVEDDDEDDRPYPDDYDIDDEDDEEDEDDDEGDDKDKDDFDMPEYDEATKALIQVADAARDTYNEVNRDYNSVDKEIKDLEKLLSLDLGANSEFYPLKGECYEYTDREYTYKLCPYDKCTQRSKNGGTETSLGVWDSWGGDSDNPYSVMSFKKGQNCWNGPDRSVNVKLSCGMHNEVRSASEPNRCEYEYTFTTPAVCSQIPVLDDKDPFHDEL